MQVRNSDLTAAMITAFFVTCPPIMGNQVLANHNLIIPEPMTSTKAWGPKQPQELLNLGDIDRRQDEQLIQAAQRMSATALSKVWDNPADAAYNDL